MKQKKEQISPLKEFFWPNKWNIKIFFIIFSMLFLIDLILLFTSDGPDCFKLPCEEGKTNVHFNWVHCGNCVEPLTMGYVRLLHKPILTLLNSLNHPIFLILFVSELVFWYLVGCIIQFLLIKNKNNGMFYEILRPSTLKITITAILFLIFLYNRLVLDYLYADCFGDCNTFLEDILKVMSLVLFPFSSKFFNSDFRFFAILTQVAYNYLLMGVITNLLRNIKKKVISLMN